MRFVLYLAAAIATLAVYPTPSVAELAQQWRACTGNPDIDWETQIASCTAIIQSEQETPRNRALAYTRRGAAWSAEVDYDRAIADFSEAIKLDPTSAQFYYNRGTAWSNKRNYDRAISDLTEAIKLDPKYITAYNNRSNAWRNKHEYERAIADANEAIRLDPKFARAYATRTATWLAKSDYDRAIADANEAIKLDAKLAGAYSDRSAAWLGKGAYDRAIADANEAIRLDPKLSPPHTNRGAAWAYKGDYDRAIADVNEAIRLNPNFPNPYVTRGKLYENKGDYGRAVADYNEAIRLDPTFAIASTHRSKLYGMLDRLAFTYLQIGQLDRALAEYNAVLKLNPKLATSLYGRSITKMKKGDVTAGNMDATAAKAIQPDVAVEFAKFGPIFQNGEATREPASTPQYAALHVQDPATKKLTRYVGSVVWRLQFPTQMSGRDGAGRVDATVEIPELRFGAIISFSRNTDKTLPASHIVEITVNVPADFEYGGIAKIPGIAMAAPPFRGEPLFGRSNEVAPGKFSVGLSEKYVLQNLNLLREQPRINIPIAFSNGRPGFLEIDKGPPGQLALGPWTIQ